MEEGRGETLMDLGVGIGSFVFKSQRSSSYPVFSEVTAFKSNMFTVSR